MEKKIALVTGATSGIGFACAKILLQKDFGTILGSGRHVEAMEELSTEFPETFVPLKCDFSNKDEIYTMFGKIKEDFGGIDLLVNNAGIFRTLDFCESELSAEEFEKEFRDQMEINVFAATNCAHLAVEQMKEKKSPCQIVNIGSLSGKRIKGGYSTIYGMSKFAINALSKGLRLNCFEHKLPIRVSEICPGLVETNVFEHMGKDFAEKAYSKQRNLDAKDIADCLWYIVSAPSHVMVEEVIITPTAKPM